MSHLVLCAGGVACCRYQQGLSSQLIGQGYCAEGQAGRAQRTADYDSGCWTVRGSIMWSQWAYIGPRYYNYLQYNTYYQLFSSTPDTDHKQPN